MVLPKKNILGADPISPFLRPFHKINKGCLQQTGRCRRYQTKHKKIVIQGFLK